MPMKGAGLLGPQASTRWIPMKLDFFVIGTQKGGSTFLLNCLREHPDIYMPATEVSFFEDAFYDPDRLDEFEAWFAPAETGMQPGGSSPRPATMTLTTARKNVSSGLFLIARAWSLLKTRASILQ